MECFRLDCVSTNTGQELWSQGEALSRGETLSQGETLSRRRDIDRPGAEPSQGKHETKNEEGGCTEHLVEITENS